MNHYELAIECLTEAEKRHETLTIMLTERDYSDVVRQSANIVDLSLQSLLCFAGIEAGKKTDLFVLVEDSVNRFPQIDARRVRRMRDICKRLAIKRKKVKKIRPPAPTSGDEPRREPSAFSRDEAVRAIRWSGFMVETAQRVIKDFDD